MIFDKVLGFLNKFIAMLAPRESILLGNILLKFPEIVLTMDRTDQYFRFYGVPNRKKLYTLLSL